LRLRERLFEPRGFGTPRLTKAQELRSFFTEDLARDVRSALWSWREPMPAIIDAMPGLDRLLASAANALVKPLVPRRFLRARRRFGSRGATGFSMFALARALGLRSEMLRRPFAPRSVLFVCTGNIMRSVLAAAVFRDALEKRGIDVVVDSAGLRALPDQPAAQRTLSAADGAGLDLRGHRSKRIDAVDLDAFDAVFAMDRLQAYEIGRRYPTVRGRTYVLGACLPGYPRVEIEDPNLAGDDEAREILALVKERAAALAELTAGDAGSAIAARAAATPSS